MSSFANLFGKSTKVDENIEQLFKNTKRWAGFEG